MQRSFRLSLSLTVAAVALASSPIQSVSASAEDIPLKFGMNYEQARANLIAAGWQPHVPTGAMLLSCGSRGTCVYKGLDRQNDRARKAFFDMEVSYRKAFRNRGWYETVHCYQTGAGWCFHSFTDVNGRELLVRTGSGLYGSIPNVDKFYFASN